MNKVFVLFWIGEDNHWHFMETCADLDVCSKRAALHKTEPVVFEKSPYGLFSPNQWFSESGYIAVESEVQQ